MQAVEVTYYLVSYFEQFTMGVPQIALVEGWRFDPFYATPLRGLRRQHL